METTRGIKRISRAHRTIEGAGVVLYRAFGFYSPEETDPFLLLDDFRSDNPNDYKKGFPWHPHRGIETITYILEGKVKHEDSIGNKGTIGKGDIQWMTAGSGIFHQEMPERNAAGRMYGFQLWANLSAQNKMTNPQYQDYSSDQIPLIEFPNGMHVKVIAGSYNSVDGPVQGIKIAPEYLDISIPKDCDFVHRTDRDRTVILYIYDGSGTVIQDNINFNKIVEKRDLVMFDKGDCIKLRSSEHGLKCLYISGNPIHQPIAWHGPIVMNTTEELETAYSELQQGTFIKSKD